MPRENSRRLVASARNVFHWNIFILQSHHAMNITVAIRDDQHNANKIMPCLLLILMALTM